MRILYPIQLASKCTGPCQYRDAVVGCAYKRATRVSLSIRDIPRLTRTVVWYGGLPPDPSSRLVGGRLDGSVGASDLDR